MEEELESYAEQLPTNTPAPAAARRRSLRLSGRRLEGASFDEKLAAVLEPSEYSARGEEKLFLSARWLQFGRHRFCASLCRPSAACVGDSALTPSADGNGQPRPLLRGWIHLAFLVCGCFVLLHPERAPIPMNETSLRFTAGTLVGYVGSVCFHMCPWATLRAYTFALVFDFLCIQGAFLGQIVGLVGPYHVVSLVSLVLFVWLLGLCVAGLYSGSVMWQYRRQTRKFLVLGQAALSCLVELQVIRHKPTAMVIALAKAGGIRWFAAFGRFDAPRSSGLVVPGLWSDHCNFQCVRSAPARMTPSDPPRSVIATLTHLLQIRAAATQVW